MRINLVSFHIQKNEVIISLSPGSHSCCQKSSGSLTVASLLNGILRIFLYLCGLQFNYYVSSVDLFFFILLNIHWISWICKVQSFTYGKISAIISFNIPSLSLYFSGILVKYMLDLFALYPRSLNFLSWLRSR